MGMSGGGGDGGAAERKAKEDARQQDAIAQLNKSFGIKSERSRPQSQAAPVYSLAAQSPAAGGSGFAGLFAETDGGRQGPDPYLAAALSGQQELAQAQSDADYAAMLNQDAQETEANRTARDQLYGKFAQDAKSLQLEDLTRDKGLAERDVSFDLARRGLFGGSRQIDAGRDVTDQFNRGVLTAENNAQNVANQARQGDEKTRVNLINGIRGGMSEADAVSAALNGMQNTAAQAATDARSQNVGGFFDAIRNAANSRAEQDSYQRAFEKYRAGGGLGGGGYGGNVSNA